MDNNNRFLDSVKPNRTQLTFSLTQDNKDKLQRIASQKGMSMAGVLSSWIANYSEEGKNYDEKF